ncbi:MAG TPA: glycosyltransferase, partial [Actinoplanes sp.]|nr:glycosyltransferase [Actinoplanes sp.]
VLTYDSAATIEACLASLAAQHRHPGEVIVVDDDSTDHTLRLVRRFAATGVLPVRVIRNGSHNISRGRNLGLAAARTELVAFLDSDARAEPGWVAGLVDAFADERVAVVGGDVVVDHATAFAAAIAVNDGAVRELATAGELLVSGCNMAVHTARVGGQRFDERWVHAEDIEYVDRVGGWAVAPAAVVWHESRATVRGYARQMYRYGLWKVRYTIHTGNLRLVDWTPLVAVAGALALGVTVSPWWLLAYPALSVAETTVVAAWRRPAARLLPLMLLGWLVKNTGWGLGTLVALAQQVTGRSRIPRGAALEGI